MRRGIVVLLLALVYSTSAFAKHHHKHYRHHHYHNYSHNSFAHNGRPHAWCGWWMRQHLGVRDAAYNLARNWAHWGHATSAHIGAIVVWSHHVGIITGGSPGNWVVTSGNDGHAVRSRRRSVAGAIAFRA